MKSPWEAVWQVFLQDDDEVMLLLMLEAVSVAMVLPLEWMAGVRVSFDACALSVRLVLWPRLSLWISR
jgi:hypothetical protein